MEGDFLTKAPSSEDEAGGDHRPKSFSEVFDKMCPYFMIMGMSYDDYWNLNTVVHKAYREAYEIRKRNDEWSRWRLGAYFYNALLCAAPLMRAGFGKGKVEAGKYPEEPWPLTRKEEEERQAARDKANYEKALAQRRAASDAALKRRAEEGKEKEANGDGDRQA